MSIVREMLNREDLPEPEVSSQMRGVAVGEAPAGLMKACSRLMELLDTPEDIPFLSHLIQREIITWSCGLRRVCGSGLLQQRATSATERRERLPG